jgi:hypothetical protein
MDFDFYVPEEIKEEAEDSELNEAEELELEPTPPLKPTPPSKPAVGNGWRLPPPGPGVVLRKTKSEIPLGVKSDEVGEIEENINDITPTYIGCFVEAAKTSRTEKHQIWKLKEKQT